jgi:hypothetical protein
MRRFIKNILLFAFLVFIGLSLKKAALPYYLGNNQFNQKRSHFQANQADFNTIFFGSSRIYRHINPILFDSLLVEEKIHSYNFGCRGAANPEAYFLYENFVNELPKNQIKYAILEIQRVKLFHPNETTTRGSYWNTWANFQYGMTHIWHSNRQILDKITGLYTFGKSFIYSFYDLEIFKKRSYKLPSKKENATNGFYAIDQFMQETNPKGLIRQEEKLLVDTSKLIQQRLAGEKPYDFYWKNNSINPIHYEKLLELIEISKKKGIHLFIFLPPKFGAKFYAKFIPIINQLPQKNVINMFGYQKYADLFLSKHAYDYAHLKGSSAVLHTRYLAELMREKVSEIKQLNKQN